MKLYLFLLKFLLLGALFIVSNQQLYLSHNTDRATFYDMYYNWLSNLFDKTAELTGYVINSEWLPQSSQDLAE